MTHEAELRKEQLPIAFEPEAASDQSSLRLFDATFNQVGPRGIIYVDADGIEAASFARANDADRTELALASVERFFPDFRADFSESQTLDWGADRWSRGATARFAPGQLDRLLPELARAEGRLHFAGDHTSVWAGLMEGALESGERAAREVIASL